MTVKELIEELKHYDWDCNIKIAWFSNNNYNITDRNICIYIDTYEDSYWNQIATKDVVIDLGDFSLLNNQNVKSN